MNHLPKQWTLKSLTIGPHLHEMPTQFWEDAFMDLPPLPSVDNVTIIYPAARASDSDCRKYFDRLLTRKDLFPALKQVNTRSSIKWR